MTVNTCSNLGTGAQVFSTIVGTDAEFRSITAGAGVTVVQNTNDINVAVNQAFAFTFTGTINFGTPSTSYTARVSPTYGSFVINRNDTLAIDPIVFGVTGFASLIERDSGTDLVVPLVGHATSGGTHAPSLGACWGVVTEATNLSSKTATAGELFGAEFAVINEISTSTAGRHAGVLIPFKNRLDTQSTPVNGSPTGGNSYNKNSSAVYIDCGGGRGSVTSIQCGWNKGIYFNQQALDSAGTTKAIGIDMTALDNTAPEGGKFSARVSSAIAIPSDLPISLSTNLTAAQVKFIGATGNIEFQNNGSQRFAVNQSNGTLYAWDGGGGGANTYFLDMLGTASPNAFFNFRSSSRIAATATAGAATAVAPAGYLKILIDGVAYKLAYYLN